MVLTPTQNEVAADVHRFRVLNCGRRWGKTTLAIEEIKGKALAKPCRIAYVAPTIQQTRDIAWAILIKELRPVIVKSNESRLELVVNTVNGSQSFIYLKGWEAIDTLRGQQFDFLVIDEIASMRHFWLNWQEVIRPTLTDTKGEALFISTPKGFNDFYELFNLQGQDQDYKSFHYTTYDNPYIPREEVDKAKQELTEDRFAQEYLADFRKSEGLVYKEFSRIRHLFDKLPEVDFVKEFGGLDFGFTNPAAAISIKKDRRGCYWVHEEWYKTGITDAQIADYVAALKWDECYPDPESASGIAELKRRGVNVREVLKNKDSIRNGVNTIRELFNTSRLRVHSSCRNLIWELETYSYPTSKPDRNEEENPIKENDHALDALRYAVSMDNTRVVRVIPQLPQPPRQKPNIAV
jgi:PBSX family phage terminase large subunit